MIWSTPPFHAGALPMSNTWNIIMEHNNNKKIMGSYDSYRLAKEALDYRYLLWYHLGSDPEFKYAIKKVKRNE